MADTKLDARDTVVRAVSALQERTVFIQVVKKKEKKKYDVLFDCSPLSSFWDKIPW